MKRRRFITFGSILAMVLSLATVIYGLWLVTWHKRGTLDTTSPLVMHFGTDRLEFQDGNSLEFRWTHMGRCKACSRRHSIFEGCDGKWISDRSRTEYWRGLNWPLVWSGQSLGRMHMHYVRVNELLPILLLGAYPLFFLVWAGLRRFRRCPGHCLHCDYDLTGNESGVCPECGNPAPTKDADSVQR